MGPALLQGKAERWPSQSPLPAPPRRPSPPELGTLSVGGQGLAHQGPQPGQVSSPRGRQAQGENALHGDSRQGLRVPRSCSLGAGERWLGPKAPGPAAVGFRPGGRAGAEWGAGATDLGGFLSWIGAGPGLGALTSLGSGGDVTAAGSYPCAGGLLRGARAGLPSCQQPCREKGGGSQGAR